MKKIVLFCVLGLLALTSCDELEKYNENSVNASSVEQMKVKTVNAFGPRSYFMDISKVNYGGHSYILFDVGEGMNGVVHDPDCPCHNTITNESDVSRPND